VVDALLPRANTAAMAPPPAATTTPTPPAHLLRPHLPALPPPLARATPTAPLCAILSHHYHTTHFAFASKAVVPSGYGRRRTPARNGDRQGDDGLHYARCHTCLSQTIRHSPRAADPSTRARRAHLRRPCMWRIAAVLQFSLAESLPHLRPTTRALHLPSLHLPGISRRQRWRGRRIRRHRLQTGYGVP